VVSFYRDGRLVERDEIVAINGESILDNDGGPEAMQQVRALNSYNSCILPSFNSKSMSN
jgi:hypothetical protein